MLTAFGLRNSSKIMGLMVRDVPVVPLIGMFALSVVSHQSYERAWPRITGHSFLPILPHQTDLFISDGSQYYYFHRQ